MELIGRETMRVTGIKERNKMNLNLAQKNKYTPTETCDRGHPGWEYSNAICHTICSKGTQARKGD